MKSLKARLLIIAVASPALSLVDRSTVLTVDPELAEWIEGSSTIDLAQTARMFPFDYKLVRLNNGFKAYLIKTNAPGQISFVAVARVGSRDEWEPGKTGFARFFAHVVLRGTETYPDYDAMVAGTGADRTSYYLAAAADSLEQIMDLESDRVMDIRRKDTSPPLKRSASTM